MAIIGQPPFIAMSNKKKFFQKTISSILIVVLSVNTTSTVVFAADSIMQNAQLGETFANSLKDSIVMPSEAGGVLTLPSSGQGNPIQININDLYPGTSSTNERDASFYFPGGNMPTVEQMINAGDSESGLNNEGTTANQYLGSDALLDKPSLAGAAYQIVLDQARTPSRDFSNDPMLNQTRDIVDNMDIIAQEFGDCKEETSYFDTSFEAHSPSYERCERVIKPAGACEIDHTIDFKKTNFEVKVASKGLTWLTVDFDLKNGTHNIIQPSDGHSFVAQIPTLDFDELCANSIVSEGKTIGIWDWANHGIPGPIDSTVIYRVLSYPTCENGLKGVVQIQDTSVSSSDEYVLGGNYLLSLTSLTGDDWSPDSCLNAAKMSNTEFCSGGGITYQQPDEGCSAIFGTEYCRYKGCINLGGSYFCPGGPVMDSLQPSPIEGIPNNIRKIHVDPLQCNFNVGQMDCYTDANGEQQCPYNEGNNLNSCAEFEQNPQCGFISSQCLKGAEGSSGECFVYEDTYDCGNTVRVPTVGIETKYSCSGEIRCMGTDCISPTKNSSQDFARVSALLQVAQTMGQDLSCTQGATSEGGDDNIDIGCTIFKGEGAECKKAVGGIVNCCEKPDGISLADYVGLVLAVPKLDTAIMSIGKDSSFKIIKSGYEALREPIVGAFQEISKPFTGLLDNVTGAIDSVKGAIDGVLDQLKEKMVDMFNQVFGNVAAETGAGAAGGVAAGPAAEQAGEQIVNNIGSALSVIGNIYTIYSVTMLAIKMIYKCTEKELELNVQRVLKNTHYIGSYCKSEFLGACIEKRETYCMFKSPLSRILQEQVRHQLALSWGTPEEPECQGLTIEQFAEVDWTMVNLDEWLAILGETGNLPDPATMSLQQLTGAGTTLDLGSRIEAETRTMEHFQDIDTEKIRRETSDSHQPYNNYIPAVP